VSFFIWFRSGWPENDRPLTRPSYSTRFRSFTIPFVLARGPLTPEILYLLCLASLFFLVLNVIGRIPRVARLFTCSLSLFLFCILSGSASVAVTVVSPVEQAGTQNAPGDLAGSLVSFCPRFFPRYSLSA